VSACTDGLLCCRLRSCLPWLYHRPAKTSSCTCLRTATFVLSTPSASPSVSGPQLHAQQTGRQLAQLARALRLGAGSSKVQTFSSSRPDSSIPPLVAHMLVRVGGALLNLAPPLPHTAATTRCSAQGPAAGPAHPRPRGRRGLLLGEASAAAAAGWCRLLADPGQWHTTCQLLSAARVHGAACQAMLACTWLRGRAMLACHALL
jgi:hypothetical protein